MTSYARYDHAQWLEGNLGKGRAVSPFGRRVAYIVGVVFGGIYNAPIPLDAVNWGAKNGITVPLRNGHSMATYDFRELTLLLLLAHELSVRVGVSARKVGYRYSGTDSEDVEVTWDLDESDDAESHHHVEAGLELVFHQREPQCDGEQPVWTRHPTIEQAVADFRRWFDADARALAGTAEVPA